MIALIVGIYFILKVALNMAIGGGLALGELIIAAVEALALFSGLMFSNYVVAAIVVLVVLAHLGGNLKDINSNWIYLLEGVIDAVCAVILCVNANVREHCSNSPAEIFGGGDK